MAHDNIVHVRPRAHQSHVAALALHFLARDGGHAERAGARERAAAIREVLYLLTGEEVPEDVCDTWQRSAGRGEVASAEPEETFALTDDESAIAAYLADDDEEDE